MFGRMTDNGNYSDIKEYLIYSHCFCTGQVEPGNDKEFACIVIIMEILVPEILQ